MTLTGKENENRKEIKGRASVFQDSSNMGNLLTEFSFAFWQDYAKGSREGLFKEVSLLVLHRVSDSSTGPCIFTDALKENLNVYQ